MVGQIETLLDQGVDIDQPVLARTLSGMQQHVLDDRIGALAVLHDLVEIAPQHIRDLVYFCAPLIVDLHGLKSLLQFVNQFDRNCREVVDEIERILDLVCDSGGQLAKRGKLLRLHQAVLRRP